MPRYNVDQVELTKIINDTPFDTIWHIWETDIRYDITGSSSYIIVRTPDQLSSGCSASIIDNEVSNILPIGTYDIGSQSNTNTTSWWSDGGEWDDNMNWNDDDVYYSQYDLICATAGYVLHITNNGEVMQIDDEINIPNISETSIEFIAPSENILYPYVNPLRPGGYGIGASYSQLARRV